MRIVFTFRKEHGFWVITCPSDKSIKESTYNSLVEAINNFLANHENIKYFEMIIPSSMPIPIHFSKRIRVKRIHKYKKSQKTISKSKDTKWAIITPPYGIRNILILHDPFHNRKNHKIHL